MDAVDVDEGYGDTLAEILMSFTIEELEELFDLLEEAVVPSSSGQREFLGSDSSSEEVAVVPSSLRRRREESDEEEKEEAAAKRPRWVDENDSDKLHNALQG